MDGRAQHSMNSLKSDQMIPAWSLMKPRDESRLIRIPTHQNISSLRGRMRSVTRTRNNLTHTISSRDRWTSGHLFSIRLRSTTLCWPSIHWTTDPLSTTQPVLHTPHGARSGPVGSVFLVASAHQTQQRGRTAAIKPKSNPERNARIL